MCCLAFSVLGSFAGIEYHIYCPPFISLFPYTLFIFLLSYTCSFCAGVVLPKTVEIKVEEMVEISNGHGLAKLSSGATMKVPEFIKAGDIIKVNTQDEIYVERAGGNSF